MQRGGPHRRAMGRQPFVPGGHGLQLPARWRGPSVCPRQPRANQIICARPRRHAGRRPAHAWTRCQCHVQELLAPSGQYAGRPALPAWTSAQRGRFFGLPPAVVHCEPNPGDGRHSGRHTQCACVDSPHGQAGTRHLARDEFHPGFGFVASVHACCFAQRAFSGRAWHRPGLGGGRGCRKLRAGTHAGHVAGSHPHPLRVAACRPASGHCPCSFPSHGVHSKKAEA